jgi:putative transposase
MKRSRFTEEQILYALGLVEAGTPPADVRRQLGCGEASFYLWIDVVRLDAAAPRLT